MGKTIEFNLKEETKLLDYKFFNNEISPLVFANLRNGLDKMFIKIVKQKCKDKFPQLLTPEEVARLIDESSGGL